MSGANAYDDRNPFMPPNCNPGARRGYSEATIRPTKITIGNQIYVTTSGPLNEGGFLGLIDTANPSRSRLAVAFRYKPIPNHDYWNWDGSHAVGTWVANGASVSSLAAFGSQDIREQSLLFGLSCNRNKNDRSTYNGHVLLQPGCWGTGLSANDPVGTQIMNDTAKRIVAEAVMKGVPFEFGAMVGYYDWFVHQWGVNDAPPNISGHTMMGMMCGRPLVEPDFGYDFGHMRFQLNVQPVSGPQVDILPISGTVQLTSSNVIYSVPPMCSNSGSQMVCPIRTQTNTGVDGFTLTVPSALSDKVWLQVNGVKTDSVRVSALNSATALGVSVDYLNELLGTKNEMYLQDIVLNLIPDQAPGLATTISLWSDVLLKRITFGVEISERNPSVNGNYSGVIGQDPDIVVPLSIRQFGMSRASKVLVNVVADNVATREGLQCKFVGNNGATVVGIPSTLRFYSGTGLVDRPDNCAGLMHDITAMRWRETLGGMAPYDAHLDMDLIFPLGPSVRLDTARNEWFGRVEAKGEVRVRAVWN